MSTRKPRTKFKCWCGKYFTLFPSEAQRRVKRSKQPLSCCKSHAGELRSRLYEQAKSKRA